VDPSDGAARTDNRTERVADPAVSGCGRIASGPAAADRSVQRGGFASEQDARDAPERELERLRRERRIARRLTLAELVETYLAQHDVQPVTIEKLRYPLSTATAVFGDRRIGELTSQEIAEWRIALSPGYRFEATKALRRVLDRAVARGTIDINPAKVGVDNPVRRRKEQHPFESWADMEALAARSGRVDPVVDDRIHLPPNSCSGVAGLARLVVHASLRPPPFEPLTWLSVLYRFDWMLPFSWIQFAPACADSSATLKAGIVTADLEPLPDAPTTETKAADSTAAKTRDRTSLFKVRTSTLGMMPALANASRRHRAVCLPFARRLRLEVEDVVPVARIAGNTGSS
jgi:hypothetical protein